VTSLATTTDCLPVLSPHVYPIPPSADGTNEGLARRDGTAGSTDAPSWCRAFRVFLELGRSRRAHGRGADRKRGL